MARPAAGPSPVQYFAAWWQTAAVPFRWTPTSRSKSASVIAAMLAGRLMPALLTTMSSPPKVETACSMMVAAPAQSATLARLATAMPPARGFPPPPLSAGSLASPGASPVTLPPKSLITTRAPAAASASAWQRPSPRPAPVTMAILPSRSMWGASSCVPAGVSHCPAPATLQSGSAPFFSPVAVRGAGRLC